MVRKHFPSCPTECRALPAKIPQIPFFSLPQCFQIFYPLHFIFVQITVTTLPFRKCWCALWNFHGNSRLPYLVSSHQNFEGVPIHLNGSVYGEQNSGKIVWHRIHLWVCKKQWGWKIVLNRALNYRKFSNKTPTS